MQITALFSKGKARPSTLEAKGASQHIPFQHRTASLLLP